MHRAAHNCASAAVAQSPFHAILCSASQRLSREAGRKGEVTLYSAT